MAARVTQQLVTVVYTTDPEARCSSLVLEVIRSTAEGALPVVSRQPIVIVVGG